MRKCILACMLCAATGVASSQALNSGIESAIPSMIGMLTTLGTIGAVLAILVVGFRVASGDDPFSLLKYLVPISMLFVMPRIFSAFFGIETPAPTVDNKPSAISRMFEWIGENIGTIAICGGAISISAYIAYRQISKRMDFRRANRERREILAALDVADAIAEYWGSLSTSIETGSLLKTSRLKSLDEIRDKLMAMLEKVHAGIPLDDTEVKHFAALMKSIEKTAYDNTNTRIKGLPRFDDPGDPATPRNPPVAHGDTSWRKKEFYIGSSPTAHAARSSSVEASPAPSPGILAVASADPGVWQYNDSQRGDGVDLPRTAPAGYHDGGCTSTNAGGDASGSGSSGGSDGGCVDSGGGVGD